jgi:DNA-binding response OmpR family regulator
LTQLPAGDFQLKHDRYSSEGPPKAKSMQRMLQRDGHEVFTASSAKEALELAARESIDLVISDLGLPGYERQ